jgi:NAD(P)H-hydrate repair Nnr-like enzyme with NAD(P)H-hydrate dehydratase domain/NAD(P)H-hydrate repair Nnr-like enzyme with NAD(P)H-hydrate epimerase domain
LTISILTPEEVRAVDAAAPEPVEVLIARAGAAVAGEAIDLLGGAYGRRVVVVAGKGNNGNDGRVAADLLRRRGAHVTVVDPEVRVVPACDLVVDAAYGTGFRGTWEPPDVHGTPVLAVDIPSGLDACTGEGRALMAERTVTFQALKPVHLLTDASGEVVVADIGLDVSAARTRLVEDHDVVLPGRSRESHKWRAAVWVVAGSDAMPGAGHLAARSAQRAGAGYVRLSPGADGPIEAVAAPVPVDGWDGLDRFRAAVVGPGLGRAHDALVRELVATCTVPCVVDGDGLTALGADAKSHVRADTVLTPHDGEFERLAGHRPGPDRFSAARELAATLGCVVLLKGPATIVAAPDGRTLVAAQGDARLATAGTGDVLSGVIGAFLAQGVAPLDAAAWGAHVHGLAASFGTARGFLAGDLVDLLPEALAAVG